MLQPTVLLGNPESWQSRERDFNTNHTIYTMLQNKLTANANRASELPRFQSEGCAKHPTRSKRCFSYILMMAGPVQSWFLFCFWQEADLNNSRFSNDFWLVCSTRWSNLYQYIITMECLCRSKKQIYHLMKILLYLRAELKKAKIGMLDYFDTNGKRNKNKL